jgi:hypothetical protein
VVEEIFESLPEVQWITTLAQIRWDAKGRAVRCLPQQGFSRAGFLAGENLPRRGAFSTGWIQQESTFWRRSLWEKAGGKVGSEFRLAGDFELWARFFEHAQLYGVETPLGGFRFHGDQKTGAGHGSYLAEAERVVSNYGGARYSRMFATMRRWAHESCPRGLRSLAAKVGLLYPTKICRHDRTSAQWRVVDCWS